MKKIIHSSIAQSVLIVTIMIAFFFVFEPAVSLGEQFTVSQTVTSEISVATPPSDIVLSPSIGSLAGGTASGSTYIVVRSGSHTGYSLTLAASSSEGMIGARDAGNVIPAYTPQTVSIPDYGFSVRNGRAAFGYTVNASTTADLATIFRNNGAACNNSSGGDVAEQCWLNASTTAVTIVNRASAVSSATTTIKFQVTINPNPAPAIPDDTYYATTTITASVN